ncbi:hypothetical protein COT62_00950 [Candidatus Roizmanbacteria bacterium CG09_land_8_20_14_0_10_41_9]|uniref:Uncharacterized protein n=1 Tax=Candidatus Roizmanbacteria bacterium CG09_land_8_20_14_0_10_41_9 TaxID=1974850 RepID=A0A2H0WTJ7_9BACT|nr:MAG: hypothetical protein COT62_00950 [Candidatus Roizmanbacteria bacterium CG09_land_8_20_14_0_10_41_9]
MANNIEARRFSRRTVITGIGATGVALIAGCRLPFSASKEAPKTPTPNAEATTQAAQVEALQTSVGQLAEKNSELEAQMNATPTPESATPLERINDLVSVSGIPKSIDGSTVDVARAGFENELGLGTEGWVAEPGKLLVGPNFGFQDKTPAEIQEMVDNSNGAIEYLNPLNQDAFENEGPSYFNLPGGGFILSTAAKMTVQIGDAVIGLEGAPRHNWMLVVRGQYADGQVDTDENLRAEFTNYIPRHIQVMAYPGKPNGGFISEGQFNQIAETSHTGGTNCGDAGCSDLSVAMFDVNTKAFTVIRQNGLNGEWNQVYSNWTNPNAK